MPRKYPALKPTPQSKDLPATQGMLYLVRTELKSDINGVRSELKGEISSLRTELKGEISALRTEVKGEINALRTEVKTEITELRTNMEVGFANLTSEVTRIALLVEEQNARNKVVLEGLTGLFQRQERIESRMDECEATVRSIARHRSRD